MDGDHPAHTKRTLIKESWEYPNESPDAAAKETLTKRSVEYDHPYLDRLTKRHVNNVLFTGIGHKGIALDKDLGFIPNFGISRGGSDWLGMLPSTDNDQTNPCANGNWHGKSSFKVSEIFSAQFKSSLAKEGEAMGRLLVRFSPQITSLTGGDQYTKRNPFQVLAEYADSYELGMSYEEKEALLYVMGGMGAPQWIKPETMTRFVNPLGCMGDEVAYRGVNAYFFDLARRVQHHSTWCLESRTDHETHDFMDFTLPIAAYAADKRRDRFKNIDHFFETHEKMDLPEAARLIGNAAKHWGIDRAHTRDEMIQVVRNLERFETYLLVAKTVQLIKERVYDGIPHSKLCISQEDATFLQAYGKGRWHEVKLFPPIAAEEDLMREINAMLAPGAPEQGEMQRLLKGGDGVPRYENGTAKVRADQYDLQREKYFAWNFLDEHDGEGRKLIFR